MCATSKKNQRECPNAHTLSEGQVHTYVSLCTVEKTERMAKCKCSHTIRRAGACMCAFMPCRESYRQNE